MNGWLCLSSYCNVMYSEYLHLFYCVRKMQDAIVHIGTRVLLALLCFMLRRRFSSDFVVGYIFIGDITFLFVVVLYAF